LSAWTVERSSAAAVDRPIEERVAIADVERRTIRQFGAQLSIE
jgi:hypothetical protein